MGSGFEAAVYPAYIERLEVAVIESLRASIGQMMVESGWLDEILHRPDLLEAWLENGE